MQLKVYDQVSNIERTVTKKAYDIINRGRKQRYKLLSYVDDDGNSIEQPAEIHSGQAEPQKKTELKSEAVAPAAVEVPEGITVIRKKPGPKPKQHAQE